MLIEIVGKNDREALLHHCSAALLISLWLLNNVAFLARTSTWLNMYIYQSIERFTMSFFSQFLFGKHVYFEFETF